MHIVICNSFYAPNEIGGAERSIRILAEELVRQGCSVTVICLAESAGEETKNGVQVLRRRAMNFYLPRGIGENRSNISKLCWHILDTLNPLAFIQVLRLLRRLRPDVLHTNNLSGLSCSVWMAARALGVPVVHTPRDFYLLCPKGTMLDGTNSCERRCKKCHALSIPRRLQARLVNEVVCISEYVSRTHRKFGFFDRTPTRVIYNPFLPHEHSESDASRVVAGAAPVFGFIGRIDPAKGLEMLIDAFSEVEREITGATLLIAGDGVSSYVEAVKAHQSSRRSNVRFLGKAKPDQFYRQIDILVVPSIWNEPLGRVVLEAFSYGLPVVVTPVGGLPEIARGRAAVISSGLSADAFSAAMREMARRISADAEAVRSSALNEAAGYTPKTVADRYLEAYRDAVAAK